MARIALIARGGNTWARALLQSLRRARPIHEYDLAEVASFCNRAAEHDSELSCIYIPSLTDKEGTMPDLPEAEQVFQQSARIRPKNFILLSSALIYGTGPGRKSLVTEDYSARGFGTYQICRRWKLLEEAGARLLKANVPLTILRPATILPSPTLLSRRLMRRLMVTIPGHDPVLQLLSLADLAEAVLCSVERGRPGVFNIAPDGVVPLRAAARIVRSLCVPFPRTLQRYTLQGFGRDDFVKMALRYRAPIVPFVTIGSAEIFPIFGQIKSRRWTRYSDWPCLPISTFPFLPVPLPSKWHTQFLPPIHVEEQFPSGAAPDASLVKRISGEVRTKMQQAVDDMLCRRRSIFFGSVFDSEEG